MPCPATAMALGRAFQIFLNVHSLMVGMKKMIVNHIDKTFVTSDAATILRELEVQHPAAKMVVMASKMQ